MQFLLHAHMPGLLIKDTLPLAGGSLQRLSFSQWADLESEYEDSDSPYEESAPVFWSRELTIDGELSPDTLADVIYEATWYVHTALLLSDDAPLLPSPSLSCRYAVLSFPQEGRPEPAQLVHRLIGPLERESVVYGSRLTYPFGAEAVHAADRRHSLLLANGAEDWTNEIRAGIDVLEETARPDSWYVDSMELDHMHGFVRSIAAAESILLTDAELGEADTATAAFGQRAAALLLAKSSDRAKGARFYSALYSHRTRLMHGRTMSDPESGEVLAHGRNMLRAVVWSALVLRSMGAPSQPLGQTLAQAWADPSTQAALDALLGRGENR